MTSAPAPGAAPLSGREAAYLAVHDVLRGSGFAAQRLHDLRAAGRLAAREAALATEVGLGAIRHAITIEHVLSAVGRLDRARTRPALRAILLTAAYQIIWMDRVPPFAAVDEAVKQARQHVGAAAAGMVNAVLRNLTRALAARRAPWRRLDPAQIRVGWDQACVFNQAVLAAPHESEIHLATATGEHPARYAALVARYGPQVAEQVAWASQAVPVTVLHRNALRIGAFEFQQRVRAALPNDVETTADAAFVPATIGVLHAAPFVEGLAFVQDPTAHAAARLVAAQPGERVLDLCAAPGGKSLVLAQDMQDRGEVVACDVAPERLALVQENVARLGLTCVHSSLLPDIDRDGGGALGLFDAAIVDVPCSNTGVIARRPEARLGFTPRKLSSLVRAQRDLICRAASHVRPGGRLVYSTCSLEPEENEELVAWFLREHANWRLDTQQTTLPNWGPRLSEWRDGGYAARLLRLGGRLPEEARTAPAD